MSSQVKNYRNAIKKLLSRESIESILYTAINTPVSKEGDLQFSAFQRNLLQNVFPGFTYEFCSTSTATTTADGELVAMTAVNLNLPDDVLLSYMENYQHDKLTPLVYANPGRCLSYTHVCRPELVKNHPMFINHCHKYGVYHDLSVGFIYPGHERTFIVFDYMGDEHHTNWAAFNHIKLELASFPFALAWLYRDKRFDSASLERMLKSLVGLTESKFLNLRKYINASHQNLQDQANDLGIKYGTLKDSLSEIKNQKFENENADRNVKTAPLRSLEQRYSFLKLLGDHTTELKAAVIPSYWPS